MKEKSAQKESKIAKFPKKATKKETTQIKTLFLEHFENARTELHFNNDFELLIAVMLSAQCTDKRVNLITPELFTKFPTPKALGNAPLDSIKTTLAVFCPTPGKDFNASRSSGISPLYFAQTSCAIALRFFALLLKKLQVLIHSLIESKGANFIAVDTHVFRVSHRLGLSNATTPLATEEDLTRIFKDNLATLHQAMVLFGRYTCKAVNPKCTECFLSHLCKSKITYRC